MTDKVYVDDHTVVYAADLNDFNEVTYYGPQTVVGTGNSIAYAGVLQALSSNSILGFSLIFIPPVTCGASPTLTLNGAYGAALPIEYNGVALTAGQLLAGVPYPLSYTGTAWSVGTPAPAVSPALVTAFAATAFLPATMQVSIAPGSVFANGDVLPVAAQSTITFIAPVLLARIDRIVIDSHNGNVEVVTGTPGATTPPAIPVGYYPLAQVLLQPRCLSITNSMITDERVVGPITVISSAQGVASNLPRLAYIAPVVTYTGLSTASNGGLMQIISSNAHGLTAAEAVGASVYITWTGVGAYANNFYNIISVDSTVAFTIGTAYSSLSGVPVVTTVGTHVNFVDLLIPGGSLGPYGSLECQTFFSGTLSTNAKNVAWTFGWQMLDSSPYSTLNQSLDWVVINQNSQTQQIYALNASNSIFKSFNIDTTVDQYIVIMGYPAVANEQMVFESIILKVNY